MGNNIVLIKPLLGFLKLKYEIKVKTGLHIGGSKESIEIGGIDNPVIKLKVLKSPKNGEYLSDVPYIPASSLKGKIRSLLEVARGVYMEKLKGLVAKDLKKKAEDITDKEIEEFLEKKRGDKKDWEKLLKDIGMTCDCGECEICKLFGTGGNNIKEPVRLRFADFYPTKDTIEMWEKYLGEVYTEMKTENRINRITSVAQDPRHAERVIAESVFEGDITFRVFEEDDEILWETLKKGIDLLHQDYLGGKGSRGYGRVEVKLVDVKWHPVDENKEKPDWVESIEKLVNKKGKEENTEEESG